MKQCPACAEVLTDAAVVCKHCGRDLSEKPPPVVKGRRVELMSTTAKWGCGTILALLVVSSMVGISGLMERLLQTPEERAAEADRLATDIVTTICELAVKQRLGSPSTAVFPLNPVGSIENLGAGRYRLASYVDAESAVGGIVRTNFVCIAGRSFDVADYTVMDLLIMN